MSPVTPSGIGACFVMQGKKRDTHETPKERTARCLIMPLLFLFLLHYCPTSLSKTGLRFDTEFISKLSLPI